EEIEKGKKIHVVITGGFHTYGLNKLLENENVNYIVITPNITEKTSKAEILYEHIFNEQYDIKNTTFANRPITEVINMLNKGTIKEIRPVNNGIEIEYISGEILPLNNIIEEQTVNIEVLSQEQSELAADIVIDIQELKRLKRENLRAQKENVIIVSTAETEKEIREKINKISDINLKNALKYSLQDDIQEQALSNEGIKNKNWYKFLTKLGWLNLRETLVAISEQKYFNNIFMEEVLGKIISSQETARENFLQEHEYYDEKESVTIQLNNAVTSIIDAMNATYKQIFQFFGIHFIAQLAAKFTGIKKHKEYNLNIYNLSKDTDTVLTKAEQHTYKVNFKVYFNLKYCQVSYSTDNFFTTASSKKQALNNAVKRAADEILTRYGLDKKQLMNLTIYLIRQSLNDRGFDIEKNITEVIPAEKTSEKDITETEKNRISKKTKKAYKKKGPEHGDYTFNIIIPGINDSEELSDFQIIYSKSPRQAIVELVVQICMATEYGYLTDGIIEGIPFSKKNIKDIAKILSTKYPDSKLPEIIKNLRTNSAPVLNDNVTIKQNKQMKTGEKIYKVVIPNFNDRQGLEEYQIVYAKDKKQAIEQAVIAIIKAREAKEVRGGFYNYRTINESNKKDILNLLYKDENISVQEVTEQESNLPETQEKEQIQVKKESSKDILNNGTNLLKDIVLNSVKALQRLTYSFLFKDNMEYTFVANSDDLARIKDAEILSNSGVKVNLVLVGETSLIQETKSRISTKNGELAFCLISKPNTNLTVYGYDDSSYGQTIDISNITEQDALISMLKYINDNSQNSIKILDLPTNLNEEIKTTDIEESAKEMFSTIGVGKTVFGLFLDAAKTKKKQTDDMFIKPSLVASNLSKEQIETFNINDINRLIEQGVTTIIIDADDKLLQEKEVNLKEIIQIAHNSGLKIMFNYSFDLQNMTVDSLEKWISEFEGRMNPFKENGGIDGFQADLSQCGELANTITMLLHFSILAQIVSEQNVGSFLSMKMPDNIYPTEYLIIFNKAGIKLVADYDSPLVSVGLSNLKEENMIINVSADKNGFISVEKLANFFEKNKVSMLSFDLPILESIDTSDGFSFNGMSITKFISSIFETTPDGQNMRGINKGRTFVINRDSVISEDVLQKLYTMYINENFNIQQINLLLNTNFTENISKYELKGFIEGLLQTTELKKLNATDISFDKKEYSNLLMNTLFEYRIDKGMSFNENSINKDLETVLIIENFREDFSQKIKEVYNVLNGRFENKIDTVINILSALKDNPELNNQEREMVLEGLLLLLLGYAKQEIIDMGNITDDNSIANIKAILRAA
ncbi:MAG: hypothetical protein K5622_04625, partial [Endomicrobiaceae bacterium]|nr:hypothetical protein [Endomicrobiaceae bacterium]